MARSAFDEIREDEYSVAHEAAQLGLLLVNRVESHSHLRGVPIGYIFRDEEIHDKGRLVNATAHLPRIQGAAAKYWGRMLEWTIARILGFQPDFVILIDRNVWAGLDPRRKLALLDHELMHCAQAEDEFGSPRFNQVTGDPIWRIAGHDIEEFSAIVERHGAWNEDLVTFARAVIDSLSHGPTLQLPTQLSEQAAG